jgi:predicted N-acetyltransferase YhbS
METIIYRRLRKNDYAEIKNIFCEAFRFDEGDITPFFLKAYLSYYLHKYLRSCTFGLAAELDGRVAGFLLGRGRRPFFPFHHWQSRISLPLIGFLLLFSEESRRRIIIDRAIDECNALLIRGKRERFDGELLLLGVRDDLRKRGIGNELTRRFFDWLRASGKRRLFLFTDEYCTVDYYRKGGYTLEAERELVVPLKPVFQSVFYLYSKKIV